MPVNPRKKVPLVKQEQEQEEILHQDSLSQEEESQENETIASYQDENNEDELTKEKEEVLKKITMDFSRKEMAKAKATQKLIPNAGVLTIINSENNGKRATFNHKEQQWLNHPNTIQVGFLDNYLLLGAHLDPEATSYTVKKQGAKAVLYNKALVEGYYLSKLLNAGEGEMELTKGGPCGTLIGTFELENMPISEKYKQQKYLAFPTNPKLRKLFTAILGEVPEDMDTDQLIGKECRDTLWNIKK